MLKQLIYSMKSYPEIMKYFNSPTLLTSCNKSGCGTCVANVRWLIPVNFLIISQKFLKTSMISQKCPKNFFESLTLKSCLKISRKFLKNFSKVSQLFLDISQFQKQCVLALNFNLNSVKFFQMSVQRSLTKILEYKSWQHMCYSY